MNINPTQSELQILMEKNPQAQRTNKGNYSIRTRVTARSNESTFFVHDTPNGRPAITRAEYQKLAKMQDEYLAQHESIQIDGYIGPDPDFRVACRLLVESANANIAAMQQQLYFPVDEHFSPVFSIIITPNLTVEGYPGHRLIAVDLENWTTRVFGSDYFGESKKGGLRMWNHWV